MSMVLEWDSPPILELDWAFGPVTTFPSSLPNQQGHGGQFLSTDGTSADWSALPKVSSLPDQAGHMGQFLRTDGTNADWTGLPGPRQVWLPAEIWKPAAQNGGVKTEIDLSRFTSNLIAGPTAIQFGESVDTAAEVELAPRFSAGGVTFEIFWSGDEVGDIRWQVAMVAIGDQESQMATYGTAVSVTDEATDYELLFKTAATPAIPMHADYADKILFARLTRNGTWAGETMDDLAYMLGVRATFLP